MTETSFNYRTDAFARHAAHSGFWHYAQALTSPGAHFDLRPDSAARWGRNAPASRMPEAPEPARPRQRPQWIHDAVTDLVEPA